jgi:hypothetical protein
MLALFANMVFGPKGWDKSAQGNALGSRAKR